MFSSSNIPLQPLFSSVGFIAPSVPAFQNGEGGGGVNSAELGKRLAETMGKNGAVLMRGHGVVVAAPSLAALVPRALALDTNAKLVAQLLAMGDKSPIYIKPGGGGGGGGAGAKPVPAGGNDSREWQAYKLRVQEILKK
jgi:ribulose-5-phosphate 4-epimerase/fuculose-1-phosphate aldolase